MKKYVSFSVLVLLILLTGCMGSKFDNDEVAAVVRGTEITVGDVRFLHGDDNIENNLYLLVYSELSKQEVEELNLDTSEEWETNSIFIKELPPKNEVSESELQDWEFAEMQAEIFDMEPEAYHLEYMERSMKGMTYLLTYVKDVIGEQGDRSAEEYNTEMNKVIDDLMARYDNEIEILYK